MVTISPFKTNEKMPRLLSPATNSVRAIATPLRSDSPLRRLVTEVIQRLPEAPGISGEFSLEGVPTIDRHADYAPSEDPIEAMRCTGFNTERTHESLNDITPIQVEQIHYSHRTGHAKAA
jgi:hypothetical protein